MSEQPRVPTGTPTGARGAPVLILATVLALVLGACGGASGSAADDANSGSGDGAASAFPVTIEHRHGSTTVDSRPQRVVTLGLSDQDAVLALGVKPVGSVDWFKERPYGKWPWTAEKWGSDRPEIVGERDEYDIEKIASLSPDVIIAQYSGMDGAQYDKLSEIAPVVAQPPGYEPYAAPWKVMSRRIGRALGEADRMNTLIDRVDSRFGRVRERHPEFGEQTMVVGDSFKAGAYSAFVKTDPKAIFFHELGYRYPDAVNERAGAGENAVEVGAERLDLFDGDRLVWLTSSESANRRIKAEPLYQQLDVVEQGRDLFVPYQEPGYVGAAISFNTVLSIPYAVDGIVPMLTGRSGS